MQKKKSILFCVKRYYLTKMSLFSSTQMLIYLICKTGHRLGDNAEMCFIELVDYDENMAKTATAKKATRTRRSKKSAAEAPAAEVATTEEAPKAE